MSFRARLDTAVTVTVALAAVAVLVRGSHDRAPEVGGGDIEEWREISESSLWYGSKDASVVIMEFVDFQCPFCAVVHPTVDSLLNEWAPDVALAMIHFPLSSHPQAKPAAVAVECAAQQHRLGQFIGELFRRQADFPASPWVEVAEHAGVEDLVAFESCIDLPPSSFSRIADGIALALEHEVKGTPTLFVNGERTSGTALAETVKDAVSRARK